MTGPTQLVELARSRARERPEAVAYGFMRDRAAFLECLSYGELDRRARATAAFLQGCAEPGDRALLLFHPGLEFLAAFFGCLYAGVVAVPAYPVRRNRSLERLRSIVLDAAPRLALTSTGHADRAARRLAEDPILPELACHDLEVALVTPPERWREHDPAPDDLAFLQYTSGSTSEPKGVMVSHRNLIAELADVATGQDYGPDSVMVSWLPTFHDMGLIYGVLQPPFHGFPAYLLAPETFVRDPTSWLHALTRLRGTHSAAPDFAYDLCVRAVGEDDAREIDLSAWRVAADGAEPIRRPVLDAFAERFGRHGFSRRAFTPCYGLAEATLKVTSLFEELEPRFLPVLPAEIERGVVALAPAGTGAGRWIAGCGVPGPRTELHIVDPETRRPVGTDRVGEVWVRGPAVARGYWRRPGATEETFGATLATGDDGAETWLRTGDLGFLHEGELFLTGRLKDLIIVRGRNLYPQDVEATAQAVSPRLRLGRGAAFGLESGGAEELVVIQELEPRVAAEEAEELLGAVRRAVTEEHDVEVAAVALLRFGALPVTTSGKMRRRAAREAFLAGELEAVASWWRPAPEAAPTEAPTGSGLATEAGALAWLQPRVARHLGVPADTLPADEPLAAHGMGSLAALRLAAEIEEHLGRRFEATLLYRYPTLAELARFLAHGAAGPAAATSRSPARTSSDPETDAVAVVGLGCRFPGAADPEAFWRLLDEGRDGTGEAPAERHELRAFLDSPAGRDLPRRGGFLAHVERFDPAFFQLSPREADLLDPQHRLLLEVAWEALESVGRPADDWRGGAAGVFVGISSNDYRELLGSAPGTPAALEPHAATGNAHTMAANRLSYLFDWRGPSLAVDTACSSSLVAVHQACEALRRGECEMALAAGVNLILAPQLTASFHRAGMLSPDGRSKTFDHRADGYGRGEGCGVVVLETLAEARRHGDRVLAVIRGSAVAQDGRSNGLTAPNPEAQTAVVSAALGRSGVRPEEVSFVEAHGTGTRLGDPIELRALQEVLRPGERAREGATPCAVGAVKTNLGHLEAAAGIAGLIKTVLALGHRRLPANLHFEAPNPLLGEAARGFTFPTASVPWEAPPGGRRVAGVSSFGFGGTLAHVVLEEAPTEREEPAAASTTPPIGAEAHLLCLSAHAGEALSEAARRWRDLLRRPDAPSAADLAHASQRGRTHLRERLAAVGRTSEELAAALDAFAADPAAPVPEDGPFRTVGRRRHDGEAPAAPALRPGASEEELRALAELWAAGAEVDWARLHDGAPVPRLDLPLYPFQRQRCWYAPEPGEPAGASPEAPATGWAAPEDPAGTLARLRAIVAPLLRVEPEALDPHAPFLEMGADSIVMVRALRAVEETFGVRVPVRQLFEATPTLQALAGFLASRRPAATAAPAASAPVPGEPGPDDDLAALVRRQAEALELLARRQREIEERLAGGGDPPGVHLPPGAGDEETAVPSPLPPWRIAGAPGGPGDGLGEEQRRHLEILTSRYTARTAGSKRAAERFRPRLADNRASAGFRFSTKEMLYPLLGDRASGSRVWDVDGNEYVDLTMGFGVYLFGHAPPFVTAALEEELARGFALGPQSRLAGEVTDLVAELTGHDRVAFCNTGTEAVMTALRLARTVTGRTRVAVFEGSYHGHSNGVLGVARRSGRRLHAAPAAPGVPPGAVADLLPLPYGTDGSLEVLRAEAPRLAAILVEPVQSRHPDLQPAAFLREVAAVAREAGAALVFDEMITGFRIAPGGAQEHFGVRADLATYGKIAGGGMPIGLVAGSRRFLDALDGGAWSYGDDSWPAAETTFFAGTFNKHPLALAASRAVLARIRDDGGRLHRALNERTGRLTGALDALFERHGAPLRTARFGSLFRFVHAGNQDPFLYHLLERGVFIWEGRNCFLSTAHSEEDLDRVVAAAEGALGELSAAGFYARPPAPPPSEPRPEEPAEIPLTTAQRQLCLLARLGPEASAAYNEGVVLSFAAPLDADRLEHALAALAARHEALRTAIDAERDRQRVLPSAPPLLAVREAGSAAEREAALAEVFAEPFPLGGSDGRPLFRAVLLRAPGTPDLLALVGHHALVDGASLAILVRDLGALYGTDSDGDGASVAGPAPSFRGYLARRAACREELDRQAAAWLAHLAPLPPPLELPGDRPRPPIRSFRGTAADAVLEPAVAAALGRRAAAMGATPFMALLAAWTLLLHRLSAQDDLLVGVPASGRADDEDAGVVGFTAHLLPIRSRLAPGTTLAGHLARVRDEVLAAFERQDVPFAVVLERLELRFDPARPPLVASTFNLDRGEAPDELFPGAEPLAPPVAFTKFDLALNVTRLGTEHRLRLEAARDLFDATTGRHLLDRYQALVAALVEDPNLPAAGAPFLSRAERHLVLVERNDAPGPPPPRKSLVEWFAERVRRHPERVAIRHGGSCLSYRALDERSARLAARLSRESGRNAGEPRDLDETGERGVGVSLEAGLDLPVALLAVLRAGAFYVPLDPALPPDRLAAMVRGTGLRSVIAGRGHRELWRDLGSELGLDLVEVGGPEASGGDGTAAVAPVSIHPQALAYVLHTSGSTGRPKGVAVPHGALARFLAAVAERPGFPEGEALLALTPLSFDIAGLELYLPLVCGGTVAVLGPEARGDARALERALDDARAGVVQATPATWRLLLAAGWAGRPGLTLLCGGEALPDDLARRLEARGAVLWNLYGPTETTIWSSTRRIATAERPVDLGLPLAGTRLYTVGRELRPVPIGTSGELVIGGAGVTRGYVGDPARTAVSFCPDPFGGAGARLYRTGDRVRLLADGRLAFLGRLDHQVKVEGHRIEPEEVAAALEGLPEVAAAAVLAETDGAGSSHLAAWLVSAPGAHPEVPELRRALTARLPAYMVPARFRLVDALPLTPNGKLDRRALAALAGESVALGGEEAAPATEMEATLAALWAEVLGRERVGVEDNFFDLGGTSSRLARVHVRAEAALGRRFPFVDCIRFPTVRSLAGHLSGASDAAGDALAEAHRRARLRRRRLDRRDPAAEIPTTPQAPPAAGTLNP